MLPESGQAVCPQSLAQVKQGKPVLFGLEGAHLGWLSLLSLWWDTLEKSLLR